MKKILSLILIMAITVTALPYNAYSLENNSSETVYIDGVEFSISTDENLNTTVTTVGMEEESTLVLNAKGEADIELASTDSEIQVNIENLTSDNIEAVIIEEGQPAEQVESITDLTVDEYAGQNAAVLLLVPVITSQMLLAALLFAGKVAIIAGVTVVAIDYVLNQIKQSPYNYYYAYLLNGSPYINPVPISRNSAVNAIRYAQSTYTFYASNAKSIVVSTGLGVTLSEHHKKAWSWGVFLNHYHTANRNGGHSFYGLPV